MPHVSHAFGTPPETSARSGPSVPLHAPCPDAPDATAARDLVAAVRAAGGRQQEAAAGALAFRWFGPPRGFVLLVTGRLSVRFHTRNRLLPMAECRANAGQDCMPVTAAILSGTGLSVAAHCLERTRWLTLDPAAFRRLVAEDAAFRRALFAQHARRLPYFFQRVAGPVTRSMEQRVAEWLLANARADTVETTHQAMAADLVTAREVISRRLRAFARQGWIEQGRGTIRLTGAAALSRVARGQTAWGSTAGQRPEDDRTREREASADNSRTGRP